MESLNIKFDFRCPKVIFGRNKIETLGEEARSYLKTRKTSDNSILLVFGMSSLQKSGALERIESILKKQSLTVDTYNKIEGEPTTEIVNKGKDLAIECKSQLVIGIGGGSVMDTAKAIAGLVTNGGKVEDYLEGKEFKEEPLPFILIPTTSGTGSEVTNNSVIKNHATGEKKSIRGLWANLALLDPTLTLSLPKKFTAYSGADALVQAIEALVSKSRNFISDFFARKAIKLLGENLPKVYDEPLNIELREKMMLGSLLGAISFANGKLGAVHGFAHPIGIKHNLPHGLICGILLPHVMRYNAELIEIADYYAWIGKKFHKIMYKNKEAEKVIPFPSGTRDRSDWSTKRIRDIFLSVGIPEKLSTFGINEEHLDDIVNDTKGSSLANNPRDTDSQSLKDILLRAL
ncbi:MAG: iron-containing alcohol dehydrogenase [Candidatus Lokiarchaeota archaeon]|nr:iron-containing alcohol dehydrogenase [Candidatus Lokiarchaeota archaeon]